MDLILVIVSLTLIVTSVGVAIRVEPTLPSGPVEFVEPAVEPDLVGPSDGPPRLAA